MIGGQKTRNDKGERGASSSEPSFGEDLDRGEERPLPIPRRMVRPGTCGPKLKKKRKQFDPEPGDGEEP